jgi:PTH1 family peptidyl-tRNA hydrolase
MRGLKRMMHSSLCDKCVLDGYIVHLIKPQTYMNNSGMAVQDILSYYRMMPSQLIVIHDDISLPIGEFRVKNGGSPMGHNGLKSIIQHIGSKDFVRIRIGVGEKPEEWDMAKYVLSKLTPDEYQKISKNFEKIKNAVSCILNYGTEDTIKRFNSL